MGDNVSYHEEFSTIIELITAVLFMSFLIMATAFMVEHLGKRVPEVYSPNKITITSHDVRDPFYYTGYQAYMFAWHMDNINREQLMYRNSDLSYHNTGTNGADTDDCTTSCTTSTGHHVIIGRFNGVTGLPRNSFIAWRNKHITGINLTGDSVRKVISAAATDPSFDYLVWSGDGMYSNLRFHLEYTNTSLSGSAGYNRKDSLWLLTPKTIP